MERKMISVAAILGMTAIILGAFGAHALKKVLGAEQLTIFETGVKYQMYHALFLLLIAPLSIAEKVKNRILYLVLFGVLFFSGSLYLLATNGLTSFDFRVIGIITPIGGLLLIAAWLYVFVNFFNKKT